MRTNVNCYFIAFQILSSVFLVADLVILTVHIPMSVPGKLRKFIISPSSSASSLLHCWWACKLAQPLWRTVWRFLKTLEIELPYYPASQQNILKESKDYRRMLFCSDNHYTELWFLNCMPRGSKA